MRGARWLTGAALAGLVAGSALLALDLSPAPASGAPASEGIRLVLSGELNGQMTPCGCAKPMLGGLLRRATYLRSPNAAPVVALENGDLTRAGGRQDELKAETVVELLDSLGYAAINLGEADFRLGLPYLEALQARFRGALLCGNVLGADGKAPFRTHVSTERLLDGKPVRVLIAGLLSPEFERTVRAAEPDLRLQPPAAVLEPLQEALKADAERRILLYHGARVEAERLARQFPGLFQLILYAHAGDRPDPGTVISETRIAGAGADGKHLALATADEVPAIASVTLGPEYEDNAGAAQIHRAYLDRVTAEDLLASVPRAPLGPAEGFAGSAACMGCHGEAHGRWRETAHSRALETLVVRGHGRDPECVGCHVVGLQQAGGFTTREKRP
jgi:hypothetical protein